MKYKNQLALGALLFTVAGIQACSSDDDGNPSPGDDSVDIDGGGAPNNGTGGNGTSSGGGGGEGPNTGGSGGSIVSPPNREDCPDEPNGTVASGPNAGTECWDVSKCNGTSEEQFLESCNGKCLEKFNNEAKIEGFTGTLPALP